MSTYRGAATVAAPVFWGSPPPLNLFWVRGYAHGSGFGERRPLITVVQRWHHRLFWSCTGSPRIRSSVHVRACSELHPLCAEDRGFAIDPLAKWKNHYLALGSEEIGTSEVQKPATGASRRRCHLDTAASHDTPSKPGKCGSRRQPGLHIPPASLPLRSAVPLKKLMRWRQRRCPTLNGP
jgi:hypothetical protein